MIRRYVWMPFAVLGLAFLPSPVQAKGPAPEANLQRFLASLGPKAPVPRVEKPEGLDKTVSCRATCGNTGGSVSTSCSGTCTAVDQDCDAGVQGYVECNGVRQSCSPCVRCIAWTYCPDNGSVQCEGWSCDSFGHFMCNVMCDGYHYFCPGHFGEELCY